MKQTTSVIATSPVFKKILYFFALSRTHHGLLDMMSPFFAALLLLGRFPEINITMAGIITVFSGYTAVYALNDIAGLKDDKKSIHRKIRKSNTSDLDSVLIQHPLAQDVISQKSAWIWLGFWSLLTVSGALYLNPFCVFIFFAGFVLEIFYVLLLKISYLRIVITGIVKATGPVAALYAVDSHPDASFVLLIFLFYFLWEAGGQNIPNEYVDIEEDRLVNAKTLPIKFGRPVSCALILASLSGSVATIFLAFIYSPVNFGFFSYLFLAGISLQLLILPGMSLIRNKGDEYAMNLFNKASFYPFFLLCIVVINFML